MSMYLMKYCFDSLSLYRRWENGQPQPFSPQDIYYWQKIDNTELSPRQLKALKRLDNAQINKLVQLMKERRSG